MLTTGRYCPDHPNGLWHDPATDGWYGGPSQAPADPEVQRRLVRHRVFEDWKFAWFDPQDRRRYDRAEDAPVQVRGRLQRVELAKGYDRGPLDGKPLAYTKTFAMAASSFLAITIVPVLMSLFITARVLPKEWGWWKNLLLTLAAMVVPAALIPVVPLPRYGEYRHWFALAWVVLAGMLLVPQKIIHESVNPISKIQQWIYHPLFVLAMRMRWLMVTIAVAAFLWVGLVIDTIVRPDWYAARAPWAWKIVPRFGSEFMPPLEEGDLLYMPTTDPGISMTKARELLQQTDRLIREFPEVASVMGKIGRAETATDPAPVSMYETTITLRRDKDRWRHVPVERFYWGWPRWARWLPARLWPESRPITVDELKNGYELPGGQRAAGMNEAVQVPGLTNSWTMPIRTRIDMLSTGIKTPVGVKIMGPDLATLSDLATQVADAIKTDARTGPHTTSAFAEKTLGGSYLDNSFERFKREGRMRGINDLWWAIHDGAVKRIRPKTTTVATAFIGLVPPLWASGAGADTMRRLAAPMIGGLITSFIMELLIYPVIFYTAKRVALWRELHREPAADAAI